MRVGKHILPKNSLLTGEGRIQGERLHVNILQVEYGGTIIPVELAVYDNDGQGGIFIPAACSENTGLNDKNMIRGGILNDVSSDAAVR